MEKVYKKFNSFIGLRIKNGVSLHGLAINISNSLDGIGLLKQFRETVRLTK